MEDIYCIDHLTSQAGLPQLVRFSAATLLDGDARPVRPITRIESYGNSGDVCISVRCDELNAIVSGLRRLLLGERSDTSLSPEWKRCWDDPCFQCRGSTPCPHYSLSARCVGDAHCLLVITQTSFTEPIDESYSIALDPGFAESMAQHLERWASSYGPTHEMASAVNVAESKRRTIERLTLVDCRQGDECKQPAIEFWSPIESEGQERGELVIWQSGSPGHAIPVLRSHLEEVASAMRSMIAAGDGQQGVIRSWGSNWPEYKDDLGKFKVLVTLRQRGAIFLDLSVSVAPRPIPVACKMKLDREACGTLLAVADRWSTIHTCESEQIHSDLSRRQGTPKQDDFHFIDLVDSVSAELACLRIVFPETGGLGLEPFHHLRRGRLVLFKAIGGGSEVNVRLDHMQSFRRILESLLERSKGRVADASSHVIKLEDSEASARAARVSVRHANVNHVELTLNGYSTEDHRPRTTRVQLSEYALERLLQRMSQWIHLFRGVK